MSNAASGSAALKRSGRLDVMAYLEHHFPQLQQDFDVCGASGLRLARRHTHVMDELLRTLFQAALVSHPPAPPTAPILLAAVGGYGREQLGWKSDLDIRLLTTASSSALSELAEAMLYPLWDAGVNVGHQVVTLDALVADADHDLPTATSLLDVRPLAGDFGLAKQLRARAAAGLFERTRLREFIERLEDEASSRHGRFADVKYVLEPDVKSSPGGLRDFDLAGWAAAACFGVSDLESLSRLGVLDQEDALDVAQAIEFMWSVRNRLHAAAGRKADRLTFEQQERLSSQLGYRLRTGPSGACEALLQAARAEAFVSDYHRHARAILHARERILAVAARSVSDTPIREFDLGQGLRQRGGTVTLAQPVALEADPALALRLVSAAVGRDLLLGEEARARLSSAARDPAFAQRLRDCREASRLFVSLIVSCPHTRLGGGSVLRELHKLGLLTAMLPEFGPLVARVQHDAYHAYPLDVHSLAAVDHLRATLHGDLEESLPLATRVAREPIRREILFLATLLHDLGKVETSGGHALRGARLARTILTRLGFGSDEVDEGCWLVENHLLLSSFAFRRDVDDPAVLGELCEKLRGPTVLRSLYLLTISDLATTGPTALPAWCLGMLDRLFDACEDRLSGAQRLPVGMLRESIASDDAALDGAYLRRFLKAMPQRYLRSCSAASIVEHARVAFEGRDLAVWADVVPSRHAQLSELCLVTGRAQGAPTTHAPARERIGLLAAFAAALAANRLEVHAAQIQSYELDDGSLQAVDLFWVRDRIEGTSRVERVLPKLRRDLSDLIGEKVNAATLLQARQSSRWSQPPAPQVITRITVDNASSPTCTVLEVSARDQPRLLYTLAETLHQQSLSISLAKIHTQGACAIDVFFVTEADGTKLVQGARTEALQDALYAALDELD